MKAVCVYVVAEKGSMLRGALDSWEARPGFTSIETFLEHVVSYLCALHEGHLMYQIPKHTRCVPKLKKESGEHGLQGDACTVMWRNARRSNVMKH